MDAGSIPQLLGPEAPDTLKLDLEARRQDDNWDVLQAVPDTSADDIRML
jgi:hypothetical protein